MRKIKAYTLMEVTVAMLLSAVCIGICYSAYEIIGRYYASFRDKNESKDELLSLKRTLYRDIDGAITVLKTDEGLVCRNDSSNVFYLFREKYILRKIEGLRTDTFSLAWKDYQVGFEGKEPINVDTLDRVSFNIALEEKQTVPLMFFKYYSSQNLFR